MRIGRYRVHFMAFVYAIGIMLLFIGYGITGSLLGLVLLGSFVYFLAHDWDILVERIVVERDE